MILVLQCLAIYAVVCMAFTAVTMIQNFSEVVDSLPPGTRYDVFVAGLLFVVLISPVHIPVVLVRLIRKLWQEIIDKCQLLDEDQR
jgi:hypothetical protein